jgi:hypothetical protein
MPAISGAYSPCIPHCPPVGNDPTGGSLQFVRLNQLATSAACGPSDSGRRGGARAGRRGLGARPRCRVCICFGFFFSTRSAISPEQKNMPFSAKNIVLKTKTEVPAVVFACLASPAAGLNEIFLHAAGVRSRSPMYTRPSPGGPIPVDVSMTRTSMNSGEYVCLRACVAVEILLKFEVSLRAFQPCAISSELA